MIRTQGSLFTDMHSWYNIDKWNEFDQYVSFIPPAWATEQALGIAGALLSGMQVNFPEEPETVQENIREIGASVLFFGPRLWESVMSTIQAKITNSSSLKRFLYYRFLPVCYKVAELRSARKKPGWLWRILYLIGGWAVFDALKDKVGLSRIRHAYTAGSAVSPDILHYFQAIGVNIKQLYGGTEQGVIAMHRDEDIKWETSGTIMPNVEFRLSEEGEIIVRSRGVFNGYYKNPQATEERFKGSWYHTEDFGYLDDDGHVICIDRMEDLRELSSGRKFSPQYGEVRLRFSPYIRDAIVIGGEDKAYVTAIINIDLDNVGYWAETRHIPYTTFTDLSQKLEVVDLIRRELEKVNKTLPAWARMKRFANLYKEFDADEAELTRTRKLRRTFVEDRYHDLIAALYGEDTEYAVEAPITYRDGRTGVIKTAVKVNTID
jgi:long-chain acyl-CoA synthetase